MFAMVKKLWNDESGQGLVEYALIIALVSVVLISALGLLSGSITEVFTTISNKVKAAGK